MGLINDEIGYIGGVPGPGKVYVAGVGYVDAPAQQGTYVAGVGYVTPKAPGSWSCECGAENTGKFCQKCGKAKPDPKGTWICSCGAKNTGKFCSECGQNKPEEWTCSCGHKNIGKFCNECGKEKPEEWTCSCGHKNSGKFCSECGELSPAEKAKVVVPVVKEAPVASAPIVEEVKTEPAPVVEEVKAEPVVETAPGSWACPACGEVNTTKFCQTCGMKQPEGVAAPEVSPVASAPIVEEVKTEPAPAPVVEEVKAEPIVEATSVEATPAVAPGSWVCPACGEVNTTKFCQTCGMKQPEGVAAPEVSPVASAPIVEEVKTESAQALVVEEVKAEPVVEAAPVEPAPAVAPGSWVCPACGEVNTTKFCQTCGTKQP